MTTGYKSYRGTNGITGPVPASTRFWSKVDKSGECWIWLGGTGWKGTDGISYGRFGDGKTGHFAHRWAYEEANGPIPKGLVIDHLCRNPLCVRPDHLEVVTQKENMRRGNGPGAINARKTKCYRGHEYRPGPAGRRVCSTCMSINRKLRLEKKYDTPRRANTN